jgi:hypothetical protein
VLCRVCRIMGAGASVDSKVVAWRTFQQKGSPLARQVRLIFDTLELDEPTCGALFHLYAECCPSHDGKVDWTLFSQSMALHDHPFLERHAGSLPTAYCDLRSGGGHEHACADKAPSPATLILRSTTARMRTPVGVANSTCSCVDVGGRAPPLHTHTLRRHSRLFRCFQINRDEEGALTSLELLVGLIRVCTASNDGIVNFTFECYAAPG